MTVHRATLRKRVLVFLDWREAWREYYCFNGQKHYFAPMGYIEKLGETPDCPHCGEELTWTEELTDPEDYAL
jgi:hypothetical protein